ncbi:hypothetical protein TRL7639_01519 [Falsiruegeria litorea R37]|uniref:Lysozyme inhibitor LprI N-terminal domain-containing protein n=1 Tax=Falsiruegeria litorea R37 TaxID=1200284 RepID=A0A1Y5SBF3_9RHOB|nr:hypothetical protein [Falsiruegeria litorea]SLN33863.1 hypothetical protein TRL7639_01519 [Falsiruegeria litorea R37]
MIGRNLFIMIASLFLAGAELASADILPVEKFDICLSKLPKLGARMGDYHCVSDLRSACEAFSTPDPAEACFQAAAKNLTDKTNQILAEIDELTCDGKRLVPAAQNMIASISQTREWGCEGTYLGEWECTLKVEARNWESARFVRNAAVTEEKGACP